MYDFIHVFIFVTVSKCRKSPKLMNIVIHVLKATWHKVGLGFILQEFTSANNTYSNAYCRLHYNEHTTKCEEKAENIDAPIFSNVFI